MAVWDERAARNEALFREVNEQVQQLEERLGTAGETAEFLCECADDTCIDKLTVATDIYENVRAHPRRFLIRPGHQRPELEDIISISDEYLIVEKRGHAGEIVEQADPR